MQKEGLWRVHFIIASLLYKLFKQINSVIIEIFFIDLGIPLVCPLTLTSFDATPANYYVVRIKQ